MGELIRAVSGDGGVSCCVADLTDAAGQAEQIHKTSAVVTAALGRLMSAAAIMGSSIKNERGSVTLRLSGCGPAGTLIAVADSGGNVRCYVENAIVELPLKRNGKLDVSGAVGESGMLYVVRDAGSGEPYVGRTPIVSGEIAEDIAHYYATSEQVPSVCSLGVLVNPDLTVQSAGGFLAQLLPGAEESAIAVLEGNIEKIAPISSLLAEGKTPEEIAGMVLCGLAPRVLERSQVAYRCDCSRDRMYRALLSLGREELLKLADERPETEVCCHFCGAKHLFQASELAEAALVKKTS